MDKIEQWEVLEIQTKSEIRKTLNPVERAGKTLNKKSEDIYIGSRMTFPAATAEATKTSHPKQSEVGRYLHRKLNDFPSHNGGKGKVKDVRD